MRLWTRGYRCLCSSDEFSREAAAIIIKKAPLLGREMKEIIFLLTQICHIDMINHYYKGRKIDPLLVVHRFTFASESDEDKFFACYSVIDFRNKTKNKNRRFLCWSLALQEYNLDIRHVKAVDNV